MERFEEPHIWWIMFPDTLANEDLRRKVIARNLENARWFGYKGRVQFRRNESGMIRMCVYRKPVRHPQRAVVLAGPSYAVRHQYQHPETD